MTRPTKPGMFVAGVVLLLTLLASCSSKPLVSADGSAGETVAGGAGAGTGGSAAGTGGVGGEPAGGSGEAVAVAFGCEPGRQLAGGITVLACSVGAGRIEAGPADLYWIGSNPDRDPPTFTLLTMPKAGGPVRALADVEDGSPSLRVDGSRVFWTDRRDLRQGGVLQAIDLSGVGLTTLVGSLRLPGSLALDGAHAYFGTVDGNFRVPRSGGEAVLVADGLTLEMQVVDGMLYWLDHKGVQTELGTRESMAVFRVPVEGNVEPQLLMRSFEDPGSLVVVQDRIFWTTRFQGEIWSMDVGGGMQTLVVENPRDEWDYCCKLVSDGRSLFLPRSGWSNDHPEKDGIVRVSLDGVDVDEVVLQRFIQDIAVDEEFIYFTGRMETPEGFPSAVFRAPK